MNYEKRCEFLEGEIKALRSLIDTALEDQKKRRDVWKAWIKENAIPLDNGRMLAHNEKCKLMEFLVREKERIQNQTNTVMTKWEMKND